MECGPHKHTFKIFKFMGNSHAQCRQEMLRIGEEHIFITQR